MRRTTRIDWESAERDYRVGQLTVRQIADKHDCAVSGLMLRAKKGAWTRDLSEAVNLATKARIRAAVTDQWRQHGTNLEQATCSEVEVVASQNAQIILGQQRRVGRLNELLERLVAEVEAVTTDTKSLAEIAKALAEADPAAAEAVSQLKSLRNRVATLKDASAVAAALNNEERKIFRLDDGKPVADNSIESLLRAMKADPLCSAADY